jgi:hypothetical protein
LVDWLPLLVPIVLAAIAVDVLSRSLFLANDSMHHYSHVWYISSQLFDHARLPYHFQYLDGGHSVTFPYGLVPYLTSAVLYRPLGDWAVTFTLVLGVAGMLWAAGLAWPAMRNPWFLLIFALNPFLIDSIYSFQFSSVWSMLFFFLFVWSFERRTLLLAACWFWLAVSTHPVVGGFCVVAYLGYVFAFDRRRLRDFVRVSVPASVGLIPVLWMTLETPTLAQTSTLHVIGSVADTVARRGTIVLLPLLSAQLWPWLRQHYSGALRGMAWIAVVGILFSAGAFHIGDLNRGSYPGAVHRSADMYGDFFQSTAFQPGATYRVMEPTDREDGMYRFMKQGAVLGNEFFSESAERVNWTRSKYACYTSSKSIDFVAIEAAYDRRYHKNESALLSTLVDEGKAGLTYFDPAGRFKVYDIRPFVASTRRPASIQECKL